MKTYKCMLEDLGYDPVKAEVLAKTLAGWIHTTNMHFVQDMLKQAEGAARIDLYGDLMIVADRLYGVALGLQYFMKHYTALERVGTVYNLDDALSTIKDWGTVNYVIFAGFQENERNYSLIQILKSQVPQPLFILWASPDGFTKSICNQYGMNCLFDRYEPLYLLMQFIQQQKH